MATDHRLRSVAFIGSANALGMMYALELKKLGHNVSYFVTTPRSDTLSRPEFHYPETPYPYEDWIVEWMVPHPLRACLLPGKYLAPLVQKLEEFDFVILSGMYLMLARNIRRARCIFLSHGSDLDVWCNRSLYRHHLRELLRFGEPLAALASCLGVAKMRRAFKRTGLLIDFSRGLSPTRDSVREELTTNWPGEVLQRFDVSFRPLAGTGRTPPLRSDKLVLLCAVRCSFEPGPGFSPSDDKGVDRILRGVGSYIRSHRMPIELHIVEKGKDLAKAKQICNDEGLTPYVTWHKEMPFHTLLGLYEIADICFDQVASSWLGAIGCYALYLGRPLIANSRAEILSPLWTMPTPVCEAQSADDVRRQLVHLESTSVRAEISGASRQFAEQCLGPDNAAGRLHQFITRPA